MSAPPSPDYIPSTPHTDEESESPEELETTPALSPGHSAIVTEAMALSPTSFCKRLMSSPPDSTVTKIIASAGGTRGSLVPTPFHDDPYMLVRLAYSPTATDTGDCATWDGGKTTWGGRVKAMGIVPVCVCAQESWGEGSMFWREKR
nr:hypothetical protein [Tanacetum cinerariifolium]